MVEKEKIQGVPEGWEKSQVKELCFLGRGRVISEDEIVQNQGIYPVFSSQSMNNGEMGRINSFDFEGEYVTWTTDGAYAGTVFYRTDRFNCTNVCGTLKLKNPKYSHKLLAYTLLSQTKKHVSYIGNPKLMNGVMAEIQLIFPTDPNEQRTIASILSTCDEAIEKTDAKIEKLKRIKQGLMQDLFRYGIDENGKMRSEATHHFKNSPLGRIPEEWEVVELRKYASIIGGFAFKSQDFKDYGIQLIKIGNLYDNKLSLDREPVFLPSGFADKYKRFVLSFGDIIMSMTGTYGKRDYGFAVSIGDNNKYLLNQRVCKFLPKNGIDKLFLHYLLHTELYLKTLYLADGTKQANLDESDILDILVPIPVFSEQSRIASVLSSADEAIEKEEAYKNKLLALKRGLMEDLLSGKVRVNKLIKEAA